MSEPVDLAGVARLYEDSLRQHGAVPMGVGWKDIDSHRTRFHKLAGVIWGNCAAISINDLGCGYGAFFEYLNEAKVSINMFRGYDVSEDMLAEARRRIQAPNAEFILGAKLDQLQAYLTFALRLPKRAGRDIFLQLLTTCTTCRAQDSHSICSQRTWTGVMKSCSMEIRRSSSNIANVGIQSMWRCCTIILCGSGRFRFTNSKAGLAQLRVDL
jgi:SAM-dependent methyltransferase